MANDAWRESMSFACAHWQIIHAIELTCQYQKALKSLRETLLLNPIIFRGITYNLEENYHKRDTTTKSSAPHD